MYKVMVVDDEPIVRKGLISFIDWSELECKIVYEASNGIEALNKAAELSPDIIITDIKMPGMSGLELTEKIYKDFPSTKLILLTGYSDFSYAQAAIRYGVVDYVVKASAIENISDAVKKAKKLINAERTINEKLEKLENMTIEDQSKVTLPTDRIHVSYIVKRAMDYIAENYDKKISLKNVAEDIHVNSSYLSRLYSKEMGETIIDTINKLKIEKSKKLLKETIMKTNEISQSIGIEDAAYFSHLFRKYTGLSPVEYRMKT
jgi:two-component system, response regulator YesN